ncbi:MAG: hypothetical protein M3008_11570 [Chloroflexota bacterium]|nr:hypothetical protein [Chloroflexota bacterium]
MLSNASPYLTSLVVHRFLLRIQRGRSSAPTTTPFSPVGDMLSEGPTCRNPVRTLRCVVTAMRYNAP